MHHLRLSASFVVVAILFTAVSWCRNRPQDGGPDVPSGKLKSVSYAPFREGFSPLKEIFPLPEHLEEDLALLAPRTESIRTYSSLGGMDPLPGIARKHSLTITQGAWLGWGETDNQSELAALIASANANPDVVKRVIVGNEVLLRGEMDASRLIDYIRMVKRSVKQPVSYADVWSMYMRYPALINEVDFITIHILPYWEDEPISIDEATNHLEKVFRAVEAEARTLGVSKPIFIGESGWPALGRQRGFAVPSVVNAARYIRGMIGIAHRHTFDYNIVEAFNQPWKATLEGVVGANWGLLSAEREPVYPLTGVVTENTAWRMHLAWTLVIAFTALILFGRRLLPVPPFHQSLWIVLAITLSFGFVTAVVHVLRTSYSPFERATGLLWLALSSGFAIALLIRTSDILIGVRSPKTLSRVLSSSYLLYSLFALYRTYQLARNGRYISFPLEAFLIPVTGLIGLAAVQLFTTGSKDFSLSTLLGASNRSHHRWLGLAILLSIIGLFIGETRAFLLARDLRSVYPTFNEALPVALHYTFGNAQLIGWALCLLSFAALYLRLPTRYVTRT